VSVLTLAAVLRLYLSHTSRPAPPDGARAFDGTITSFSQVANGRTPWGCAMKTLRHIMRHGFLFMLQRDTTVADACRMMAAHNIGIVAVFDGERLCGAFSDRGVTQRVVDRRLGPRAARVV